MSTSFLRCLPFSPAALLLAGGSIERVQAEDGAALGGASVATAEPSAAR